MQVKEMKAPGGVTVQVTVPDGVPIPGAVTLSIHPKTTEEFESAVEAMGGVSAFRYPKDGGYWDTPATNENRTGGVCVMLYPPPQKVAGVDASVRAHPFFGEYAARAAVQP